MLRNSRACLRPRRRHFAHFAGARNVHHRVFALMFLDGESLCSQRERWPGETAMFVFVMVGSVSGELAVYLVGEIL
jgi:hypothetical protein